MILSKPKECENIPLASCRNCKGCAWGLSQIGKGALKKSNEMVKDGRP